MDWKYVDMVKNCVDNNNIDRLKNVIEKIRQIDESNAFAFFHVAANKKHYEILKILLNHFPIHEFMIWLCENDKLDLIQFAIETLGNDVKNKFFQKYLPLQICARMNSVNVCKYLMTIGADVNELNSIDGYTALHVACVQRNVEIVKLLCGDKKIQINTINFGNNTALHVACSVPKNIQIVKILLAHVSTIDVNLVNRAGETAFIIACERHDHDIVKHLLAEKIKLNLNINENNFHVQNYKLNYPEKFN